MAEGLGDQLSDYRQQVQDSYSNFSAMRREAAEQRIRIRSQVYDGKVDDALARYGNIERKVDEMEAYADTIKGREPTLEAEFAALERDESVEKELEALKAKRAKSSAKSSSKKSED